MSYKTILKVVGVVAAAAAVVFTGCVGNSGVDPNPNPTVTKGTFADSRDGKTYKTVKVGDKTWMAENLNFAAKESKCYGEGGVIINEWDIKGNPINRTKLSNKEVQANCAKYGRLYDWATALKACPAGFHLPSDDEWTALVNYAGGEKNAEKKLKSKAGWNNNGNGTDDYGWSALPGGYGDSDGSFNNAGSRGYWWSATEGDASYARSRNMLYNFDVHVNWNSDNKTYLHSVRCVAD